MALKTHEGGMMKKGTHIAILGTGWNYA